MVIWNILTVVNNAYDLRKIMVAYDIYGGCWHCRACSKNKSVT